MLRRRRSKSKPDLNRRKSTSSVHSVHLEHIDQASAQRDAQAAAAKAFSLARRRAAADNMPLFPPTPPTPESSPGRRRAATSCDENAENIRRRQSVRFVGPSFSHLRTTVDQDEGAGSMQVRRQSDVDASQPDDNNDSRLTNSNQGNKTSTHPSILPLRPPRRPPRDPPPPPPVALPGLAAGYMDALKAGDEHYTPEDDIASAPSSYRRLRKSRSMFTSEDAAVRPSQDGLSPFRDVESPASQPRQFLHSASKEGTPANGTPSLRTPRSMNFLRRRRILTGSRASKEGQRGGSLDQGHLASTEERPLFMAKSSPHLKNNTPTPFGPKAKRSEPAMRKSLRSQDSTDDVESPLPDLPVVKDGGSLRVKARNASRSIKTKLKNLFSLSRPEEQPASLPSQHIDSQRTHVSAGFNSIMSSGSSQEPPVAADWGSLRQVPSGFPSLQSHAPPLFRSNKGSVESLRTDPERKVSDDRSLTSWAHSGPSTLTSQQQQQWREWERQRLSIIGETGMHAPSPSMLRQPLAHDLFQQQDDGIADSTQLRHQPDSQRIYSALMKRAQAIHKKNAEIAEERRQALEPEHDNSQPCTSGRYDFCDDTPRTIRNCASQRDLCFSSHPVGTPTRPSKTEGPFQELRGQARQRSSSFSAALKSVESRPGSATTQTGVHKLPAPLIDGTRLDFGSVTSNSDPFTSSFGDDARSEGRRKPLMNRPSAFFASPTSHLFRTASPYRRALKQIIDEDQAKRERQTSTTTHSSSEGGTQIHIIQTDSLGEIPDDINDPYYSESVYSEDGDGSGKPELDLASPPAIGGRTNYRPAGYCGSSSDTSVDWKTWLSVNMAKLELSPSSSHTTEVDDAFHPVPKRHVREDAQICALPTMPKSLSGGHVREEAQICEDTDDSFQASEPPTHKPSLPTTPLATVEQNVLKLSPQHRSAKHSTPPAYRPPLLHENSSPSSAPPIPPKSSLRAVPARLRRVESTLARAYSPSSLSSSPGLSAAIQKQFGPVVSRNTGRGGAREMSATSEESEECHRGYFETTEEDLPAFI